MNRTRLALILSIALVLVAATGCFGGDEGDVGDAGDNTGTGDDAGDNTGDDTNDGTGDNDDGTGDNDTDDDMGDDNNTDTGGNETLAPYGDNLTYEMGVLTDANQTITVNAGYTSVDIELSFESDDVSGSAVQNFKATLFDGEGTEVGSTTTADGGTISADGTALAQSADWTLRVEGSSLTPVTLVASYTVSA